MSSSFNQWFIRFGFRVGLGILLMVGLLYYAQKRNLQSSMFWVIHTFTVQKELNELEKSIEHSVPVEKIARQMASLNELISDNLRQSERFRQIKVILDKRKELTAKFAASKPLPPKLLLQKEALEEQALTTIEEMYKEESALLEIRQQTSNNNITFVDYPIILGGIFAFLLIYLGNRITHQDLKVLLEKDQELQKQSQILKQSKDALEVQTKILNLTMESMGDGLIVINNERKYLSFNSAARRLIGMSADELTRQFMAREIVAKDPFTLRPFSDDELPLSASLRGESVENFEILIESESIASRILSFNSQPLIDDSGKRLGATAIFRDVTQNRQIENQLREAQKLAVDADRLKSEFLANMSHEIRTPMNGILGMTDLLNDTSLNDQQKIYVQLINESSQSLLTIINDILDFSKIESGKLEIEQTEFNLAYTVDRTIQLLAPKAREKSLNLISYTNPKIPAYILGDAGRVGQILMNLLGNAIKFTSKGKVIVWVEPLRITEKTVEVKFTVEDTGIGLEEAAIQRLFKPFVQADGSTSKKFGGTGLGLSISKQLTELMGGEIGVQSSAGVGSQFWFKLPFSIAENQMGAGKNSEKALTRSRILLLEEDADWGKVMGSYFESWNLECRQFQDAALFLREIQTKDTLDEGSIILLGNCQELNQTAYFLEKLREFAPGLPVIVFLNHESLAVIEKIKEFGIHQILIRPFEQSILYNLMMNLLSEKGKLDQIFELKDVSMNKPAVSDGKKFRILLAEDNSVNQMIAQAFLKEFGYSVHTVANGLEVLKALHESEFDLILMDCQMPEMDGFEATQEIRKNVSTRIPIIALTANAMKGDEEKCKKAGMNGYLSKPFRKEQLKAVLEENLAALTQAFDPTRLDMYQTYKDESGQDLRVTLIHSYLETTPIELENLKKSSAQDPASFERIAHTLKSSSAAVGGVLIAGDFQALESGNVSVDQMPERLKLVESEFNELKVSLEDYLKKITG